SREFLTSFLLGVQNYWFEMATVVPLAIEKLGAREFVDLRNSDDAARPPASNLPRSRTYSVRETPLMLPARIGDPSQGWALYFAQSHRAQKQLAKQHQEAFTLLDLGSGRTPVVIFGIDHRQSDLGTYLEMGAALLVRPRTNRFELPGILFLSLIVSDQF